MKAVTFSAKSGAVAVETIPAPQLRSGFVLVRTEYSLLSAGTERARLEVGSQNLLGKARERPDQARQAIRMAAQSGPLETWRVINDRLNTPALMGYSSAGTIVDVGHDVADLQAGMRVACAGGGYANHAEVAVVPQNLCVPLLDGVSARDGAFATLGAIALQGIHQSSTQPGSRVAVIGLGLVGQLAIRILKAYGYHVIGIDRDPEMLRLARAGGITAFGREEPDLVDNLAGSWGGLADAVIITAATKSSDPVSLAGDLSRDRGVVVIVGDVTVAPPRPSYYHKELNLVYSRSYGPGRYDPGYEEGGQSYPVGFVPWDERRNLQEIVRLLATHALDLESLEPAIYPVDEAAAAYSELTQPEGRRRVAVLLSYGSPSPPAENDRQDVVLAPKRPRTTGSIRLGAVGAGSFASRMLLPPLKNHPNVSFSWILSSGGLSAVHQGRRFGFERAIDNFDRALDQDDADAVLVMTRHDSHARYVTTLLQRGISVFCEKPLGLSEAELEGVASAWLSSPASAMVGFNRRFAPAVQTLRESLDGSGPVQVMYRVAAGQLSPEHWYFDPAQGGRLLGEVCHFIDTATWLVHSEPVAVTTIPGDAARDPIKAQSFNLVIEYKNGSTATINYGGSTPPGAPKELIEVMSDRVVARIEDFGRLQVWGRRKRSERYRGAPKGHSAEMSAFVSLVQGMPCPETDFVRTLWSSLTTCLAAASLIRGERLLVAPSTDGMASLLTADLSAAVST